MSLAPPELWNVIKKKLSKKMITITTFSKAILGIVEVERWG